MYAITVKIETNNLKESGGYMEEFGGNVILLKFSKFLNAKFCSPICEYIDVL